MIPNATQARAQNLLALYAAAEEALLAIVARRLTLSDDNDAPQWVQKKLREVSAMKREVQEAVDHLAEKSLAERIKLIWSAHDEGADGLLRELGLEGHASGHTQAVVALIDDIDGRFSELHRRILRDAEDVYRDVLAQALPMATMGTETTRQAMRRALNAFADQGITGFVDSAGRRWGMAEYAEMAVRTGMMNASLAGYTQEALAHGEDLVIISDHTDECPMCRPWERRVLSLTGAQSAHPDCTGTVGEARDAGLFHPNCLHSMTVYVPGLTIIEGSKAGKYTAAQDSEGYSKRQLQRYMERNVRKWKRRQAASITPEDERFARAYVSRWQRKLRTLTGETKLPRKYEREGGRIKLSEEARKLKPIHLDPYGAVK